MEQSRSGWGQALHIFVVSSFAFAQPIFDVIGHNPTFFVAHETGPLGVGVFSVVVLLLPAALLIALHRLARAISERLGVLVCGSTIGALVALTSIVPIGRALDLGPIGGAAVFLAIASVSGFAYLRFEGVRRLVTWLALAPGAFLVLFLTSTSVRVLLASDSDPAAGVRPSRTPVVVVVLDELSLGSILTPDGEIDDERFPGFGGLAERSTWYPEATTNAYVTPVALPTIATGVFPRSDPKREIPAPVTGVYPQNLFTLLGDSHDVHAGEFVTRLCPTDRCAGAIPKSQARKLLFSDTAIVFLRTVLPRAVADRWVPSIGSKWANFLGDTRSATYYVDRLPGPLRPFLGPVARFFSYGPRGQDGEAGRMDAFLGELEPGRSESGRSGSGKPGLHFLHLNLPHDPYEYLPGLERYAGESFGPSHITWPKDQAVTDLALQRYLLQLKATDELVQRLVARLADLDMWDRSLVVLMADHGVSFIPDAYRRRDDGRTAGGVVPIPLFVKYPNQRSGVIDRRDAQMIDVLPTIADVLDVDVPWEVDGVSLRRHASAGRSRRVFSSGRVNTYRNLPVTDISERISELFGHPSGADDVYAWGPHADLVGRIVDEETVRGGTGVVRLVSPEAYDRVRLSGPIVPAGLLATFDGDRPPPWVAVAINGRIAGLGSPRFDDGSWRIAVMLSPRYFKDGSNRVEVYAVDARSRLARLSVRPRLRRTVGP